MRRVTSWENLFMPYVNNKGADQPALPRSLISVFVVRCLDTCWSRNFKTLASLCSWADRFESYLVENPEDRFSRDMAHFIPTASCIIHSLIMIQIKLEHDKTCKITWLWWCVPSEDSKVKPVHLCSLIRFFTGWTRWKKNVVFTVTWPTLSKTPWL